MKTLKSLSLSALICLFVVSLYSCKTKKIAAKPAAPTTVQEQPPVEAAKPEPAPVAETPAPVEKPDFNFSNLQFEFNSAVLKTASFQILDNAAKEIKKDSEVKITLNGHSSAEGTPEHNMSLSVDRANSVKSYLVNTGISADKFTIKGFGASSPVTTNATEEGKALNRRVEIKINQ